MKVMPTTILLATGAALAAGLAWTDPWASGETMGTFVSNRSAALRLFSQMPQPDRTQVVLHATGAEPIRFVPGQQGHDVWVGDTVAGPADAEAFDGLWSSLRMATTLRAVSDGADVGRAVLGTIEVLAEDTRVRIELGQATGDGAGLYATVSTQAGDAVWVVETELGEIIEQAPRAWIARRAVVVDVGQIHKVQFADRAVAQGVDGLWRSQVGEQTAVLSADAVRMRLDRLVGARLNPLLDGGDGASDAGEPWVTFTATSGRRVSLTVAGPCPGQDDRKMVLRGLGWPGCIESVATEPWALPGTEEPSAMAMIESRLVPYLYDDVLTIEQLEPTPSALRLRGTGWQIEQSSGPSAVTTDVSDAEVLRWYSKLHTAEVEAAPSDEPDGLWQPQQVLRFRTDSTGTLTVGCLRRDVGLVCRRDGGPRLRVRDPQIDLIFSADTFADRKLLALRTEDARAIEILPGGERSEVVRQSVHFDLGVWRLDAPVHPDGDDALSDLYLEELLVALASVRSVAWVPMPTVAPLRVIRIERTPKRGQTSEFRVAVYPQCIVESGGRAARVSAASCTTLSRELLHDDPLRYWLDTARGLEVEVGGTTTALVRVEDRWQRRDGSSVASLQPLVDEVYGLRVRRLVRESPPTPPRARLRVLPRSGSAFWVSVGDGWAQIEGQREPWFYALEPQEPQDASVR